MRIPHSRVVTLIAGLIVSCLWIPGVTAAPITVDWDVVPHDYQELHFGDSPHYDCEGAIYTGRYCRSLWDTGLTLEATLFSFYDDKWFDGYGIGEPESSISSGVQRIRPECKVGLGPCFESFTPLTLEISGEFQGPQPNLFIISSRGGLVKLPSQGGVASVDFAGAAWHDLAWMEVGFYLPEICEGDEPPDGICNLYTEKALVVENLTFVPEPALTVLLGAAIATAFGRRAISGGRRRGR
jgi:hypothetical protein